MSLPKPVVVNRHRLQAVDFRPYGNTIGVEADSDNPFEQDRQIFITTQASGGMAGPDPVMRSKRTMHKGTAVKARPHQAGHSPTYRTRQSAQRQGFMPGFGGFGDLGVNIMTDDTDSGGGGAAPAVDTTDFAALTAAQDVFPTAPAAAPTAAPAPAASGGPGYADALKALIGAGAQTTTAVLAAKQKAAAVAPPKSPVAALGAQAKTYWPYIAAGVGAVVVLGLLFGGGGRSSTVVMAAPAPAKTNPRKRRR